MLRGGRKISVRQVERRGDDWLVADKTSTLPCKIVRRETLTLSSLRLRLGSSSRSVEVGKWEELRFAQPKSLAKLHGSQPPLVNTATGLINMSRHPTGSITDWTLQVHSTWRRSPNQSSTKVIYCFLVVRNTRKRPRYTISSKLHQLITGPSPAPGGITS